MKNGDIFWEGAIKFIDSLGTIPAWLQTHDEELVFLYIHEGVHLQLARECGFLDPKVYGPSEKRVYRHGKWWRDKVYGAVETLPDGIQMFGDPIRVGKFFLGPRYVLDYLRGRSHTENICKTSLTDLENFNEWYEDRQRLRGDLGDRDDLKSDIRRAIHADLRDPEFCARIWECANEYEKRVSEQQCDISRATTSTV